MARINNSRDDTISYSVMLDPTWKNRFFDYAKERSTPAAEVFRNGVDMVMNGNLPVLGTIPCGPLAEAIETSPHHQVAPPMMRPRADLGDFLLEANGDSNWPRVSSGDLVMLRPNIEYSEGELCAVQIYREAGHEGPCEATLKRVFHAPGRKDVILRAFNPEFEDMTIPAEFVKVIAVFRGLISQNT